MSVVTISITDVNLEEGTFNTRFDVKEETAVDGGRAAAAYFTGYYLHSLVGSEEFTAGVADFGRQLVEAMLEDNAEAVQTATPATMFLTLTDKDIKTGRFTVNLTCEGGDKTGEMLPTTAQIVGAYMRALLSKADFRAAVNDYAVWITEQHKAGKTANRGDSPAFLPQPGNDAATLAA